MIRIIPHIRCLRGLASPSQWLKPIMQASGLCVLLSSVSLAEEPDLFAVTTTDLGHGVFSYGSFSARSLFVITSDGAIVTDPVNARHAQGMRAAIAMLTDKAVKYVVYSHQHWDHAAGGGVFAEEGAKFVSHENCLAHWERNPHPDIVLPDQLISDSGTIELGDRTLELTYLGRNHGDCMLVMQVRGSDVLYVNDLVTPYSVGLGSMPDYDPMAWIRSLKALEADEGWSRMVGGHGVPVAPRDALVQRRRYLEAVAAAVKDGMARGLRYDALYEQIELPQEFRGMRGYDAQLLRAAERFFHYYNMGW